MRKEGFHPLPIPLTSLGLTVFCSLRCEGDILEAMEATAAATSTDLRTAAQALLQSATHEVKFESTGHKFTFVSPCSGLSASDENILESASVLAAARTFSKLGRAGECTRYEYI